MDNTQNKNDSAYNMMKYLMGILLVAFVIFLLAYFLFSYSRNDQAAKIQKASYSPTAEYVVQQQNVIFKKKHASWPLTMSPVRRVTI